MSVGNLKGWNHSGEHGVDMRIVLKVYSRSKFMRCEGLDYIQLSQDDVNCLALVGTVINLRIPQKAANF
jgi:hypothetical protein